MDKLIQEITKEDKEYTLITRFLEDGANLDSSRVQSETAPHVTINEMDKSCEAVAVKSVSTLGESGRSIARDSPISPYNPTVSPITSPLSSPLPSPLVSSCGSLSETSNSSASSCASGDCSCSSSECDSCSEHSLTSEDEPDDVEMQQAQTSSLVESEPEAVASVRPSFLVSIYIYRSSAQLIICVRYVLLYRYTRLHWSVSLS